MIQAEFPDSQITKKDLKRFLFHLAGYDYNESFNITKRPSKFGDSWKISSFEKEKPLCDKCGAVWQCKVAEGTQSQKNTNAIFHLSCLVCGFHKFWSTQGKDNFLDDLLWTSCKLTGTSPTDLNHILRLIGTGYDMGQHQHGELVSQKVVPIVHQQYLEMHEKVIQHVEEICKTENIGAVITWDGAYSSRNNNSDHAVVNFVEHVTGENLLLHLEMTKCSKELMPQAAEKELLLELVMMEKR